MDSGSGGLSIWQALVTGRPDLRTTYCADFSHYPYGEQSEAALQLRLSSLVDTCIGISRPRIIVIACNTASTLVLDTLRRQFSQPFVGVVPAIKVAAEHTKVGRIGLLATPATITRSYIDDLRRRFAPDCELTRVGSSELVHIAERRLRGLQRGDDTLKVEAVVESFRKAGCDQVVLGCTHFPLLQPLFDSLGPEINWIDSSAAICRRVNTLLETEMAERPSLVDTVAQRHRFLYTVPTGGLASSAAGELDNSWKKAVGAFGFTSIQTL